MEDEIPNGWIDETLGLQEQLSGSIWCERVLS